MCSMQLIDKKILTFNVEANLEFMVSDRHILPVLVIKTQIKTRSLKAMSVYSVN